MKEFEAMLYEFQTDYNQTHFVRNDTFKKAANDIQGPARKIFIEFLERSCTAEFSGFLLYKELGRRLKKTNPVGEPFNVLPIYIIVRPNDTLCMMSLYSSLRRLHRGGIHL